MTVPVASAAVLLALWMAWRGCRRGALATLLAWLPMAASVCVLLFTVRAAWASPAHFGLVCLLGGLATAAIFVAGTWAVRSTRRMPEGKRSAAARVGASYRPHWPDRIAGAALGVICAAVVCLGLACLGSVVSFAFSMSLEPGRGLAADGSGAKWMRTLGRACSQMADIANFGVLRHVPGIREYSREARALITVLNAPPEKLRRIAEKRGLTKLAELPEVQEAILDEDYIGLIAGVGRGNLGGLPRLARSGITKKLLTCPEIRQFTESLTPSQLAEELKGMTPEERE